MSIMKGCMGWLTRQSRSIQAFRVLAPKQETAAVTAYALLYILAAAATGLLIRSLPLPILGSADFTTDAWYALGFKIGLLLILPGIWFFRRGYRIRDLLPGWKWGFRSAAAILIALGAGLLFNQAYLSGIGKAAAAMPPGEAALRLAIGVILPFFSAAVPEEFFYRAILQTRLELTLGRIPAVLIGALLFAAFHIPSRFLLASGAEGIAGDLGSVILGTGIPVFIIGLVFALLWDRWRCLLPLIAVHWGIDILPHIASMFGIIF